jgi:uncharacterized protein YbdZ (MbtH family)
MQHISMADFGIIISDENQRCMVWPAREEPPQGWRFTAARGPRAAMQACVEQQFVPTAPAMPIELARQYMDAEWAAAEFDD